MILIKKYYCKKYIKKYVPYNFYYQIYLYKKITIIKQGNEKKIVIQNSLLGKKKKMSTKIRINI